MIIVAGTEPYDYDQYGKEFTHSFRSQLFRQKTAFAKYYPSPGAAVMQIAKNGAIPPATSTPSSPHPDRRRTRPPSSPLITSPSPSKRCSPSTLSSMTHQSTALAFPLTSNAVTPYFAIIPVLNSVPPKTRGLCCLDEKIEAIQKAADAAEARAAQESQERIDEIQASSARFKRGPNN